MTDLIQEIVKKNFVDFFFQDPQSDFDFLYLYAHWNFPQKKITRHSNILKIKKYVFVWRPKLFKNFLLLECYN